MDMTIKIILEMTARVDHDFEGRVVDGRYKILEERRTSLTHMGMIPSIKHKIKVQGVWLAVSDVRWDYNEQVVRIYVDNYRVVRPTQEPYFTPDGVVI